MAMSENFAAGTEGPWCLLFLRRRSQGCPSPAMTGVLPGPAARDVLIGVAVVLFWVDLTTKMNLLATAAPYLLAILLTGIVLARVSKPMKRKLPQGRDP